MAYGCPDPFISANIEELLVEDYRLPIYSVASDEGLGLHGFESDEDDACKQSPEQFIQFNGAIFGSVSPRRNNRKPTKGDVQEAPFTEEDALDISEDVGTSWCETGRRLGISEAVLENIDEEKNNCKDKAHAVFIKYLRNEGSSATKRKVAHTLARAGRRDVAERLIGRSAFSATDSAQVLLLKELKEPDFKLDPVAVADLLTFKLFENCDGRTYLVAMCDGSISIPNRTLDVRDKSVESLPKEPGKSTTDQNLEEQLQRVADIKLELMTLTETLKNVAGVQEVKEVKETDFKLDVGLEICDQLNRHIQLMYSRLLALTGEISQYSNPFSVCKELYEFSNGLRAQQTDLSYRINKLGERDDELSDAEKKKLCFLKRCCKASEVGVRQFDRLFTNLLETKHAKRSSTEPTMSRHRRPSTLRWLIGRRRSETDPHFQTSSQRTTRQDLQISQPILDDIQETARLLRGPEESEG